jgi:hypothetical protein
MTDLLRRGRLLLPVYNRRGLRARPKKRSVLPSVVTREAATARKKINPGNLIDDRR